MFKVPRLFDVNEQRPVGSVSCDLQSQGTFICDKNCVEAYPMLQPQWEEDESSSAFYLTNFSPPLSLTGMSFY